MQVRALGAASKTVDPSRRGTSAISVLVVDDASTMRTVIRGMLSQLGFNNVDEAEDGETALKKMQARSYDLVISDWHMGQMNGIELLKKVRLFSRQGQNKFIFSTSESSWGSKTTAKVEGAQGFLTKPFTIHMLQEKIAAVLRS